MERLRRVQFGLLGPVELRVEGRQVALGGQLQRALLAAALLHANRVVASERLISWLWDGAPPKSAFRWYCKDYRVGSGWHPWFGC
ncbi:MAG TPA: hypothetical protein VF486_21365 [Actinomycetes bacterium]